MFTGTAYQPVGSGQEEDTEGRGGTRYFDQIFLLTTRRGSSVEGDRISGQVTLRTAGGQPGSQHTGKNIFLSNGVNLVNLLNTGGEHQYVAL